MEVDLNGKNNEESTVCKESEGGTCGKPDQISWVNDPGSDNQEVLTFQGGESSKVEKPGEHDNGALSRHRDGRNHLPNGPTENYSIVTGLCSRREEYRATICSEEAGPLKSVKNCDSVDTKSTAFTTSESKRRRSASESDSSDLETMSLRARLSKKSALKKQKTASDNEATGRGKKFASITDFTEVDLIPLSSLVSKKSALTNPNAESDDGATGKGKGENSTTEVDSIPLNCRLAMKNALKKPKTVSGDEAASQRKGTDSVADRIGDDNDFESPKAGRGAAGKRKGSDLSDDQDLLTSVFSTDCQTSSTSNREAKVGLNTKKRKTKKAGVKADVSERKALKPAKKRITKGQTKSANRTTAEALEGKG